MGVHYFYTWITKRYPLIKKKYEAETKPDVDNFFLDLNGVLYRCAKDDRSIYRDIIKGKNMDEIFASIFNYVNKLVNLMQPKKRLFIAIDGVAPRAKMNNQRQRRYQSAKSNQSLNDFMTEDLQTDLGLVSFKNNSISPGTEFMFDLIDKIKFFIVRKLHEDLRWRNLEVIFSGGDCPGEGEHKIMEWIRGWRQSPQFDINESHCIYSNDADLVFLALSTHLPNILVLREVNNWNDSKVNCGAHRESTEVEMELLYVNLIREYMNLEFKRDAHKYKLHAFDIERIIDDFILIAFFIGNDFLHQLYCMNTKKGNFDQIIGILKETLPTLNDYLSNKGEINWSNFLVFLRQIEKLEVEMIEATLADMRSALRFTKRNQGILFHKEELEVVDESDGLEEGREGPTPRTMEEGMDDPMTRQLDAPEDDGEPKIKDENRGLRKMTKKYELDMQEYYKKMRKESEYIESLLHGFRSRDPEIIKAKKTEFYERFFNISSIQKVEPVVLDYAKGIQFVMYYYLHGCPSWSWYYPYFISPFLTDFIEILEKHANTLKITFENSAPYNPYEQLAYILPKASLGLVPKPYAEMLVSHPKTAKYFRDDMGEFEPFDGIWDYQWIVKLEPINDKDMTEVLASVDQSKLSEKERTRNQPGQALVYRYDPGSPQIEVKSLIKGLPDFSDNILINPIDLKNLFPFDPKKISNSQEGYKRECTFPSLHIIPGMEGHLTQIRKGTTPYDRLLLKFYASCVERPASPFSGWVYYDYPFKKIAKVNSVVSPTEVKTTGSLSPVLVNSILDDKRAKTADEVHKAMERDCRNELYHERGIDYDVDGYSEKYYSLEYRKTAWISAKNKEGIVEYAFEHVPDLQPEGLMLLFSPEKLTDDERIKNFPENQDQVFVKGSKMVDLETGDYLKIEDKCEDPVRVNGSIVVPSLFPSSPAMTPEEMLEKDWRKVDEAFLNELGLFPQESWMLYGILDSIIVKTDWTKTSSLILGQLFDIGLRFFKVQSENDRFASVVIDLIRISRCKGQPSQTALPMGRYKALSETTFYDVYLSGKGVSIVKNYFKEFPQILEYMRLNVQKWGAKMGKNHDIKQIYPNETDPNVKLFKIYQWIMMHDSSSLEFSSFLSVNASSTTIKHELDDKLLSSKLKKQPGDEQSLDRNRVMVEPRGHITVQPSFHQHFSYPKLGNRVFVIAPRDPSIPFGKTGTVTGIYRYKVEIVFDQPFIGASSLCGRCGFFKGAQLDILEVFNLSEWPAYLNLRKDSLALLSTAGPEKITEWDHKPEALQLMEQILTMRQTLLGEDTAEYLAEQSKHKPRFVRRPGVKLDFKAKKPAYKKKNYQNKKKKKEEEENEGGFFAEMDVEKKEE